MIVVAGGLLSRFHLLRFCTNILDSRVLLAGPLLAWMANLSGPSSISKLDRLWHGVAACGLLSGFACYPRLLAMGWFFGFRLSVSVHGLFGFIGKLDRLWHYSRRVRLAIRVCLLCCER